MQRLEEKHSLCQHSTIDLKTIAEELTVIPMAIVGNPQHGKTTLAKHLVKALTKLPNVKVRVWDSSTKWLFNSPCEKVFVVPQPEITLYSVTESYEANELLAYSEVMAPEEMKALLEESCICFDSSELDDIEFEREIQQQLIHLDKQRLIRNVKDNKGEIKESVIWVCEESQGVFSSNSLRKLKTILDWNHIEQLKTFGIGQFLVQNKDGIFYLKTTKYKGENPMILKTEQPEAEKKGILAKLFKW